MSTVMIDKFKLHVEDSVLLLVRSKDEAGSELYDQLEQLTKKACPFADLNFDEVRTRAEAFLRLEKAGLLKP